MRNNAVYKIFIIIVLIGVLIPLRGASSQKELGEGDYKAFLPVVAQYIPPVVLTDIWVGNADGYERPSFRPGEELRYITVGENPQDVQRDVNLRWDQVGPCSSTQIFSGTLSVNPGLWVHTDSDIAVECLGTYTNTIQMEFEDLTTTLTTTFDVVTYTTEIVFSDKQGFDKCALPTVEQMQSYWLHSPYWVFNIYLGGSSFACDNPGLDADWVWDVSQQGWEYILTWVGPQSPCFDTVREKIHPNPVKAGRQGKAQADLAVAKAQSLGINGEMIIYYDIEPYPDPDGACSDAVDAFLMSWTERLHELGFKAGAYGSPCYSYLSDWWDHEPLLDDVWIARWLLPAEYRDDVTVWGNPICGFTNEMWPDNQRLRQYAGDHPEEWPDEDGNPISMGSIDSNVLLGEITAISTTTQISGGLQVPNRIDVQSSLIADMGLLGEAQGWVLHGGQLWATHDNGVTWERITPIAADQVLSVEFIDPQTGWLVSLNRQAELFIHQTRDGGRSWNAAELPFSGMDLGGVYLDFVDDQHGWLVQKMTSSSSFSIGKLYATTDGGQTWEARTIPLGEPVQFSDPLNGQVSGGPTGEAYYLTEDGGVSWFAVPPFQPERLPDGLPEYAVSVSAPDPQNAWTLTKSGSCSGEKNPESPAAEPFRCWQQTRLWSTQDGGQTWQEIILD